MPKKSAAIKEKAAKKVDSKKKRVTAGKTSKKQSETKQALQIDGTIMESDRPKDEVVTYNEVEFELKEIISNENKVLIGLPRLTRFERARITGARSLQLSLGAPSLIRVSNDIRNSISLATAELDLKALPISIRRILPNGLYQDIPIDWMK